MEYKVEKQGVSSFRNYIEIDEKNVEITLGFLNDEEQYEFIKGTILNLLNLLRVNDCYYPSDMIGDIVKELEIDKELL